MHSHRITHFVLSSTENTHPPMLFGKKFKIWNFFNTGRPTVPDPLPAPPPPFGKRFLEIPQLNTWVLSTCVHVLGKVTFFLIECQAILSLQCSYVSCVGLDSKSTIRAEVGECMVKVTVILFEKSLRCY